jgi:hypothetical protein
VSETVPTGWDLTSTVCTSSLGGTENEASIGLTAGETVTCVFTNEKRGQVVVNKATAGIIDPLHQWEFTLTGPDVIGGSDVTTNDTSDAVTGVVDFGGRWLIPGETYTLCEVNIPAGWTTEWTFQGSAVTPYNPDALPGDPTPEDLGTRCYDFSVTAGQTVTFAINNVPPPGGDQRTIGYWANWNRCTGGRQDDVADRNGGAAEGFFLLEDVLPILIGDLNVTTCEQGVSILKKQDLTGKKMASDAAYALAAQLLAAEANLAAGAAECGVQTTVDAAQALLASIDFDGTGAFLGSKSKDPNRAIALALAATLDDYNNGLLCP